MTDGFGSRIHRRFLRTTTFAENGFDLYYTDSLKNIDELENIYGLTI